METEIKYTEHAALDNIMARFLDTLNFAGALHKLNKTLAVIKGHRVIGNSAVGLIIPTQYDATGVPGFIRDQAQKYRRTCGATIAIDNI